MRKAQGKAWRCRAYVGTTLVYESKDTHYQSTCADLSGDYYKNTYKALNDQKTKGLSGKFQLNFGELSDNLVIKEENVAADANTPEREAAGALTLKVRSAVFF